MLCGWKTSLKFEALGCMVWDQDQSNQFIFVRFFISTQVWCKLFTVIVTNNTLLLLSPTINDGLISVKIKKKPAVLKLEKLITFLRLCIFYAPSLSRKMCHEVVQGRPGEWLYNQILNMSKRSPVRTGYTPSWVLNWFSLKACVCVCALADMPSYQESLAVIFNGNVNI